MSHFTVLVVTDTAEELEAALQPFHEYECTGIEDEYVIDVDRTDEVTEFLEKTVWVGEKKDGGGLDDWPNEKSANEKLTDPKPMTRAGKIVIGVMAAIFFFVVFPLCMAEGFKRELRRQEAVQEHNCKHYGPAINKHYGREVCPPTPAG